MVARIQYPRAGDSANGRTKVICVKRLCGFMADPIPTFGQRDANAQYRDRPGAYGVVVDAQQRVAVVRAAGSYYLPGGGIDAGESPEATLAREGREECGCAMRIIREIGPAVQHVTTSSGRHFAKQCRYYLAEFVAGGWGKPSEENYELEWISMRDALKVLALDSDVWAVRQVERMM